VGSDGDIKEKRTVKVPFADACEFVDRGAARLEKTLLAVWDVLDSGA
jgi:hypothetical protein